MKSSFLSRVFVRWLARPTLSIGATPMLFGALVLSGCGGGDVSPPTAAPLVQKTASAAPVTPTLQPEVSGEVAYFEAVQNDHRVGEEAPRAQ